MHSSDFERLRRQLGLTQAELARKLSVSTNTCASWERGERPIPPAIAMVLRGLAASDSTARATSGTATCDEYHRAILERLSGSIDPLAFEDAAWKLIGKQYPVVPVSGGGDDGFDGAVFASGETTYPLITTTSEKLKDNFKRNLKKAVGRYKSIASAMFATSRRVTPKMRTKLVEVAESLGVELKQVFDRDWFANALYREPELTKRLLDLTGRPSALSVYPTSQRPLIGDLVIGRAEELEALRNSKGDAMIVGQPGSGKTFLARALALEGQCLFVTDLDKEALSNAIRKLDPPSVVLDDAHVDPMSLAQVLQLRQEIGGRFSVWAVTWPGRSQEAVQRQFETSVPVIEVGLLDRDSLVELVEEVGLQGPRELVRLLVDQSRGCAGLAATLAAICVAGDIDAVWTGKAYFDRVMPDLVALAGQEARLILGAISMAGIDGCEPETLERALGVPAAQIREALSSMAVAGVLQVVDGRFAVWPEQFRWMLAKDLFLEESSPWHGALKRLQSLLPLSLSTVEVLIGARSRGASVPDLRDRLRDLGSDVAWSRFALLGPTEASIAMDSASNPLTVAEAALSHIPDSVVPQVLDIASEGNSDALILLDRWVRELDPNRINAGVRKRLLLRGIRRWHRSCSPGFDSKLLARATCAVFHPSFEYHVSDPGIGRTFTLGQGVLQVQVLLQLEELWPDGFELLRLSGEWGLAVDLIQSWMHPPRSGGEEQRETLARVANRMALDISAATQDDPGIQHRLARDFGESLTGLVLDSDVEALYPQERFTRDEQDQWNQRAVALASEWENLGATAVASKIMRCARIAERAGIPDYPCLTGDVCEILSHRVSNVAEWIDALMQQEAPPSYLTSFVRRLRPEHPEFRRVLSALLESAEHEWLAITVLLTVHGLDREQLDVAVQRASGYGQIIDSLCIRDEIPHATLAHLLKSNEQSVAASAAIGFWRGGVPGEVPDDLRDEWRRVILAPVDGDELGQRIGHWLGEILSRDNTGLACDWLVSFVQRENEYVGHSFRRICEKAIKACTPEQRVRVLKSNRLGFISGEAMARSLVGTDLEVYRELLGDESLKKHHLSPLAHHPVEHWLAFAEEALESYSVDDVVKATVPTSWEWMGRISDMFRGWLRDFEALESHENPEIAQVGVLGAAMIRPRLEDAIRRERDEDLWGY